MRTSTASDFSIHTRRAASADFVMDLRRPGIITPGVARNASCVSLRSRPAASGVDKASEVKQALQNSRMKVELAKNMERSMLAERTSQASRQAKEAADSLKRMADGLRVMVGRFKT